MRGPISAAVLVGVLATLVVAPAAPAVTPDYYPLPTGYLMSNFGIAADDHGNVWFSAQKPGSESASDPISQVAQIGRLDTSQAIANTSGGFSFFPTPNPPGQNCCATQVRSVAYRKADGRLYFVRSDGVYGFGDTALMQPGQVSGLAAARLEGLNDMADVAVSAGPGQQVWATERSTSNVAFPPASPLAGQFPGARIAEITGGSLIEGPNIATQFGNTAINSLRYDAKPDGIAVDASGTPWFAEADPGNAGYRIGRYAQGANHYDEWSLPCVPSGSPCSGSYTGTGARDVTIEPGGAVWYTNEIQKSFGRFDPATQQVKQYTLGSVDPALASATPRMLTTAQDGTIWMTVYGGLFNNPANSIVRIVPPATPNAAPTATVYPTGKDDPPLGIGTDSAGNVWFGDGNASPPGRLGRLAGVVGAAPGPTAPAGGGGAPAAPAPGAVALTPTTVGRLTLTPIQVGNGAVNLDQICVGPPEARCSLVYIISAHEYVRGWGSAVSSAKKKPAKRKPQVLARKAVTLKGGQRAKVTITLNKLGKRILKAKGRLKVDVVATQRLDGKRTKVVLRKTVVMKAKRR